MIVNLLNESGYDEAMLGLSLSYEQNKGKMQDVAVKLSSKELGHNKFLESIMTWWLITAPRYWWQQADTYRIASKQSGSTMHTALKRKLTYADFEENGITKSCLADLNRLIGKKDLITLKKRLPESFLQTREWVMSYKTLRNIIVQRYTHKVPHWRTFIFEALKKIQHPEFMSCEYFQCFPSQLIGEHAKAGHTYYIDKQAWRVNRFTNGEAFVISKEPPYNMFIKEEDLIQTKLGI